MTEAFEAALAKIDGQKSVFARLDERAVEIGAVLPVLRQLGWDTEDVTEVYPQRQLSNGGRADYDLQVGGTSRVVIEVKRWNHTLDVGNEEQLKGYCEVANPCLGVLTSGNKWQLYVRPWKRLEDGKLHRFLEFDINDEPGEVENHFREFLARDNFSGRPSADRTVKGAQELYHEWQKKAAREERMLKVLKQLVDNPEALADFLAESAETDLESARDLLKSNVHLEVKVANNIKSTIQHHIKPVSFTFQPGNGDPVVVPVKDWTGVRAGVCELMHEHHHDEFHKFVDERTEWFFDAEGQYRRQVGNTGVYVPTGGTRGDIMKVCVEILGKFRYPKESLTITPKQP